MATLSTLGNIAVITALTGLFAQYPNAQQAQPAHVAHLSPFEVTGVKIGPYKMGTAVINDGQYIITAAFMFESFADSYGPIDSRFNSVSIESLEISSISTRNFKPVDDYLAHQDIIQIKKQVESFIEANDLLDN